MAKKQDVQEIKAQRETEHYVLDARNGRVNEETFTDWKNRTEEFDNLYSGRWEMVWPTEDIEEVSPNVMNLPQVGADEFSRLVSETSPQVRCEPDDDTKDEVEAAYLRERILHTFWLHNNGEDYMVPHLAHDLAATGFAAVAVTTVKGELYPVFTRINPRGAYPNIMNGRLLDMLVVHRVTPAQLRGLTGKSVEDIFGADAISKAKLGDADIEVLDFYDAQRVTRTITAVKNGKVLASSELPDSTWEHGLGVVPVAWGMLSTADGKFRGLFDQVKGIVEAQNRIFKLQLDYADQEVYAPFFAHDVENDEDPPGPRTIYRGRTPEAQMTRVSPAGSNPQLFALLEYLERQARGGSAYPAQRQGEVGQSIASASFVHATLGQLTTTVKAGQKAIAFLRRQLNSLAFSIDEKFLDERKALLTPGREKNYRPKSAIKGIHRNQVIYGAGAGLDAINKKVALEQDLRAGITSLETAREQTDYIIQPASENQKVEKQRVAEALVARIQNDPQFGMEMLMKVAGLMNQGNTLFEAAEILASEAEELAQQAAPAEPGLPGEGTPPASPDFEDLAAGALPEATAVEEELPPNQPLDELLVNRR